MDFDLLLRRARIAGADDRIVDIGIAGGRIAAIAPELASGGPAEDLGGRVVVPGFIETHIHLDKACLIGRCTCGDGTLAAAVAAVAAEKHHFTEADVYERAARVVEAAIMQGTNRMRTHVEVDPRIGLTSFIALKRLKADYAWGLDLQLCAFPQEGLLDDPGCEAVLVAALESGADLVGGAPYMDRDPHGQIDRIFALARRFDVDIDFHLDFSLDTEHVDIEEVCRQADRHGWGGRVACGHVSKLSAVTPDRFMALAGQLAASGVAVTALPATDLYLMGRDWECNIPRGVAPVHRLRERGVTCSISTNNVLNPFTPYGDASLIRMANLYANVAQIGSDEGLAACLDMVTGDAARILNLRDYAIVPGGPADLVVLNAQSRARALAELAQPLFGLKAGRRSFTWPLPALHPPGPE